jgi:hypothetical protein
LAERHDRGAHRRGAEGDEERHQQQRKRDAGRTVIEDQVTQAARVERQQVADDQIQRRTSGGALRICSVDSVLPIMALSPVVRVNPGRKAAIGLTRIKCDRPNSRRF